MINHQMNEAENGHPSNSEKKMAWSKGGIGSELPKRTDLDLKFSNDSSNKGSKKGVYKKLRQLNTKKKSI